jgi:hypothetical protein
VHQPLNRHDGEFKTVVEMIGLSSPRHTKTTALGGLPDVLCPLPDVPRPSMTLAMDSRPQFAAANHALRKQNSHD